MTCRKVIHPKKHFNLRFPALAASTFKQITTDTSKFYAPFVSITVEACYCVSSARGCDTYRHDSYSSSPSPNCELLGWIKTTPEGGFEVECNEDLEQGACQFSGNGADILFAAYHDGFNVTMETRMTTSDLPEPTYEENTALPGLATIETQICVSDASSRAQACRPEDSFLLDFSLTPPGPVYFSSGGISYDELAVLDGGEVIIFGSYFGSNLRSTPLGLYAVKSNDAKTVWESGSERVHGLPPGTLPLSGSPGGGGQVRIKARISGAYIGQDASISVETTELDSNGNLQYSSQNVALSQSGIPLTDSGFYCESPTMASYTCVSTPDFVCISFPNSKAMQISQVTFEYHAPVPQFGEMLSNDYSAAPGCDSDSVTPCVKEGGYFLELFNVSVQECIFEQMQRDFTALAQDECLSWSEFRMSIYSGSRSWVSDGISFYTIDADLDGCITEPEASARQPPSFNFSLYDTDRDGCLRDTVSEFRSAFPSPPETTFAEVDRDLNGCITLAEASFDHPGMTQEYFSMYDANDDGCLMGTCEFSNAFERYPSPSCPSRFISFGAIDLDGDQCVTFDEYRQWNPEQLSDPDPCACEYTPPPSGRTTCDESEWPDKKNDLVCGECRVLVDQLSSKYDGTCNGYCSSINRTCVGAWEANASDTCVVSHAAECYDSLSGDGAICECSSDTLTVLPPQTLLGGLMGLAGVECASEEEAACPIYLERLNKCLCNECCPEVHFSLASAIAFGSGVPGCADATCAASSLARKLYLRGISLSDFTDPIRRKSVPAIQSMMMELLEINPSEVTMRVGQPEAAARPNSVSIDLSLSCLTVELCADIWSRKHGYICTGSLAVNLTELFGTTIVLDPKEHECNVTAKPGLPPALAAAAGAISGVVSAVVAGSVAGAVAGSLYERRCERTRRLACIRPYI